MQQNQDRVRGDFLNATATAASLKGKKNEDFAYVIDEAKRQVTKLLPQSDPDHQLLLSVLNHAPTFLGQFNVACNYLLPAKTVQPSPEDSQRQHLRHMATYYATNLLQPLRGRTDKSEAHVANESNGDLFGNAIPLEPKAAGRNSKKYECLDRDGYRCVISGKLDPRAAAENHIKLEAGNVEITQAAHIIPYALNNFETAADSAKMKQIWTTLKEFGGVELKQLTGGGINHPRNIMTLTETLHVAFDDLRLSLDPVIYKAQASFANDYKVLAWDYAEFALPKNYVGTVRLESYNIRHDLPDPRFLAVHAAICKIWNEVGQYRRQALADARMKA